MKTNEIVTYKRTPQRSGKDILTEIFSDGSAFASIAAIMVSRITVMGSMAPFGIAWYAVNAGRDKYLFIFASTIFGILLSGSNVSKLSHIFAVLLLFTLKKLTPENRLQKSGFIALAAALCSAITGTFFSFFSGIFYYSLLTTITEALAVGGLCIVFSKSVAVISQDWKVSNDEESVAVAILAGAVVAGFQGISLFDIKLANILSMYIILFTAYKGGIGISGAVGGALGLIAGISQGDAPALTGAYGFIGIAAGIMNIFGKPGVVLSAALANSLFAGYYNSSTIILVNYIEIVIAGLGFFFTPEKALNYMEKYSIRTPVYDASGGYVMRLKSSIGEALASLKNSALAISRAYTPPLRNTESDEKALIKSRLIARVCDNCSLSKYCWSKNIKGSNRMFDKITSSLFDENSEEVGSHISGRCVKGETLCETAKELYDVLRRENIINSRVDFFAKAFAEGWGDYIEIIKSREEKIAGIRPDYPLMESEFCRELAARGIKSPEISIIKNDCGRFEISLRTEKEILFDIIPFAEKITLRRMCVSDEYPSKSGFVLKLQEKLNFDYDVSIITMNKHGSDQSGDNCDWFVSPEGIFYCLVCDGMGSGKDAHQDALQVTSLFKTLVLGGFHPGSAIRIINGGMISDSSRERCVSLDCLTVNLFTGKTEFIKAGAVATVVKTGGEIEFVRENSIPLGVLDIENLPVHTMFLEKDACIVMMTDGVTDNIGDRKKGEECIGNILKLMELSTGKEISDSIMMSAVAEGIPKDDMMVTAIRISGKD